MKKFENVYQDAALMKKALLGEANESEQQELEKRLAECPDLQKVYEQLQNGETLRVAFEEYKGEEFRGKNITLCHNTEGISSFLTKKTNLK